MPAAVGRAVQVDGRRQQHVDALAPALGGQQAPEALDPRLVPGRGQGGRRRDVGRGLALVPALAAHAGGTVGGDDARAARSPARRAASRSRRRSAGAPSARGSAPPAARAGRRRSRRSCSWPQVWGGRSAHACRRAARLDSAHALAPHRLARDPRPRRRRVRQQRQQLEHQHCGGHRRQAAGSGAVRQGHARAARPGHADGRRPTSRPIRPTSRTTSPPTARASRAPSPTRWPSSSGSPRTR